MPRTTGVVMRFSPVVRAACVLLLVAVAIAGAVASGRQGSGAMVLRIFLAVALGLIGLGTVEVLGVAHRLVPGGIERVAPGRRRVLIRWSEVVAIEWIAEARWYQLTSRSGERVRVYQQLRGVSSFARAALEGVPPQVIAARPGLRRQLELASQGVPPPEPERDEWRAG